MALVHAFHHILLRDDGLSDPSIVEQIVVEGMLSGAPLKEGIKKDRSAVIIIHSWKNIPVALVHASRRVLLHSAR